MKCSRFIFVVVVLESTFNIVNSRTNNVSSFENSTKIVRKHVKRLKKQEGAIKLVGGRDEYEGNVEILHNGKWGAICDDEWDSVEARIICKQLGYENIGKATHNSYFGPPKRLYWMDNIYCSGLEQEITECHFDGWGNTDCDSTEAAGVICHNEIIENDVYSPLKLKKPRLEKDQIFMMKDQTSTFKQRKFSKDLELRIQGGLNPTEGRVEIKTPENPNWTTICGDGWSLLEAIVVCKVLNLGYASAAPQTRYFGGKISSLSPSSVSCRGNEDTFAQCTFLEGSCLSGDLAAVQCVQTMSDLVIDSEELIRTAHLEDRQMFFLQCAMEENCLASHAYEIQKEHSSWHLEARRLLRFTARILNAGTADFRPAIPKHLWEWHMCHMHYHSMEVFATFDIFDSMGTRVAEGHKASFCLEDNQCLPGVEPRYACANYGDQGISVNCTDIYKYTVDCQWVDITDIEPGDYTLKVAVNPEFKIPEMTFENNAAYCQFRYTVTYGMVFNCSIGKP